MRISLINILMVCSLASCGAQTPPQVKTQDHKPDSGPPDFHFTDEMPDTIEFEQGYGRKFDVLANARVPGPGAPVVTVENLPQGATFDGRVFSWTPSCAAGDIEFKLGLAEFVIRFTLRSSEDAQQFVQRRVNLRVHQFHEGPGRVCGDAVWRENADGPVLTDPGIYFDQNFQDTMPFFQGSKQTYDIRSFVHVYPNGSVNLTVENLPQGSSFDGNQLVWKPSCSDSPSLYVDGKRTVTITFHAVKVGDERVNLDRTATLISYQQTPCTDNP